MLFLFWNKLLSIFQIGKFIFWLEQWRVFHLQQCLNGYVIVSPSIAPCQERYSSTTVLIKEAGTFSASSKNSLEMFSFTLQKMALMWYVHTKTSAKQCLLTQ